MTLVKAKFDDRGKGTLEFVDGVLKFSVERGRFKKKSEVLREISLTDIESVTLNGNELSVTWKGVADIFIVEKPLSADPIFEEVDVALKKQMQTLETEKAVSVAPKGLIDLIKASFDTTDSLFDILRSLHGRIDWTRVGDLLKRSGEIAKGLSNETYGSVKMEFAKSEAAMKNNHPEEISKEVYENLKSLNDYLNQIALNNVLPEKTHPNYEDAKRMLLAYYVLNDIIIGIVVGDKEIDKERREFTAMLEALEKTMALDIDHDPLTKIADLLVSEKVDESLILEDRTIFKQQFDCLMTK
jgi:hypothetical protein